MRGDIRVWAAATPAPLEQPGLGERAGVCVRARARMCRVLGFVLGFGLGLVLGSVLGFVLGLGLG